MDLRFVTAAVLLGAAAACEPTTITAVADPGGAFHPGAGCGVADLHAGGSEGCVPAGQLGFERPGDDAVMETTSPGLSGRQVSCRRSYCGTGALSLHAEYRWPTGPRPAARGDYMGEVTYRFAEPVDLYGKTISFAVYVDGLRTP